MSVPCDNVENEKKWQAEDDARTLMRAEEVKSDKARLKAALAILKEQNEQRDKILEDSK